jgi:hypothetical protein
MLNAESSMLNAQAESSMLNAESSMPHFKNKSERIVNGRCYNSKKLSLV